MFPQLLCCFAISSGMHQCKKAKGRRGNKAWEGKGFIYPAFSCFGILWSHSCPWWLFAVGGTWHHTGPPVIPGFLVVWKEEGKENLAIHAASQTRRRSLTSDWFKTSKLTSIYFIALYQSLFRALDHSQWAIKDR